MPQHETQANVLLRDKHLIWGKCKKVLDRLPSVWYAYCKESLTGQPNKGGIGMAALLRDVRVEHGAVYHCGEQVPLICDMCVALAIAWGHEQISCNDCRLADDDQDGTEYFLASL